LESFEIGWSKLGSIEREKWIRLGNTRRYPSDIAQNTRWSNFDTWTQVLLDQKRIKFRHREYETELQRVIAPQLPSPYVYFDIPKMTIGKDDESYPVWMMSDITRKILNDEVRKAVERVKSDILENGLDAIKKYYPPKEESDE
jgi:hypothetical protein